jgi:hypothetical protein
MATADARKLLPPHLEPMEAMHTRSVLAVLAFQFTESEVGEYDELVMAIITPPVVEPGKPLPKAAFFPFMVATSTAAARAHAIERWHLPHYMADVDFDFQESDGTMKVVVSEEGQPIVELTVTEHEFRSVVNPYHCFTIEGAERFKVNIFMDAPHSEHDEEKGELVLHEHPMTAGLDLDEVSSYPIREEWYHAGVQTFEEMETT